MPGPDCAAEGAIEPVPVLEQVGELFVSLPGSKGDDWFIILGPDIFNQCILNVWFWILTLQGLVSVMLQESWMAFPDSDTF